MIKLKSFSLFCFFGLILLNLNFSNLNLPFTFSQSVSTSESNKNIEELTKIVEVLKKKLEELFQKLRIAQKDISLIKTKNKTFPLSEVSNKILVSCNLTPMRKGTRNNSVYLLQVVLKRSGYYPEGLITGYFGSLTSSAVKRFQKANNLNVSGIVDEKTSHLLNELVKNYYSFWCRDSEDKNISQFGQANFLLEKVYRQKESNQLNISDNLVSSSGGNNVSGNANDDKFLGFTDYFYDVVVVGAGTGGTMAAIQAARMGTKVALLEETDWVGGQATAAAVSCMDGGKINGSGLYSEFAQRIIDYYKKLGKTTNTAWNNKLCFEPLVGKNILLEMISDANKISSLDLYLLEEVTKVLKDKNKVYGLETASKKRFYFKVVIDATEYGDLLPLAGARYRVGNSTSDNINLNSCVQDITYVSVIKKYPNGLPEGFSAKLPPDPLLYDNYLSAFQQVVSLNGNRFLKYPVDFYFHNSYRGVPDSSNPINYTGNQYELISKTTVNWANDYPTLVPYAGTLDPNVFVPVRYIEDKSFRKNFNCEAKIKTLSFIHYIQNQLNQPLWSVANDEGYKGVYNLKNDCSNISQDYKEMERNMPVIPYVREGRRLVGIYTLTSSDIKRTIPFGNYFVPSKDFPTSLAVGDYPFDQHNCNPKYLSGVLEENLESVSDIDENKYGLFEIPFEVFIPEVVEGLLVAEKNLSSGRIANSALRLQPVTMSTGQAAGIIAALSARKNISPRNLNPIEVQYYLLQSGSRISKYDYNDVSFNHPFWKAIQFVSVHGFMKPSSDGSFRVNDYISRAEAAIIISRLAKFDLISSSIATFEDVALDHYAYKEIEALYREGVTSGCSSSPKKYCPDNLITRAQFASFLVSAFKINISNINSSSFIDVPSDFPFFRSIQYLYDNGIVNGCSVNPLKFCPDNLITRGQVAQIIASFLWKKVIY